MTTNPNDAHRALKERATKALAPTGLVLRQYVPLVGDSDTEDYVQLLCTIDIEQLHAQDDQSVIDATFAVIIAEFEEKKEE